GALDALAAAHIMAACLAPDRRAARLSLVFGAGVLVIAGDGRVDVRLRAALRTGIAPVVGVGRRVVRRTIALAAPGRLGGRCRGVEAGPPGGAPLAGAFLHIDGVVFLHDVLDLV